MKTQCSLNINESTVLTDFVLFWSSAHVECACRVVFMVCVCVCCVCCEIKMSCRSEFFGTTLVGASSSKYKLRGSVGTYAIFLNSERFK